MTEKKIKGKYKAYSIVPSGEALGGITTFYLVILDIDGDKIVGHTVSDHLIKPDATNGFKAVVGKDLFEAL